MRLVASGKVKDVYEAGDAGMLLFRFSDRISAYDVRFDGGIPRKGEALCAFAEYWFVRLGVPSHFVERTGPAEMLVRRLDMIPLECVVRGYLYGSLYDRVRSGAAPLPPGADDARLAARLPAPVFDPTTKSDDHDEPVGRDAAVRAGLVTGPEYDELSARSVAIYETMAAAADAAGFVLADLKLEFGRLDGRIVLGDSIGPDEFRLWPRGSYEPGSVQVAYDKQILRDWLAENGHKRRFEEDRAAGREPRAPPLPPAISARISERYVKAHEMLAGRRL